jgi:hypothetical protein
MIQGDFSRYVDGQGRLIPITDPTTGQPFQNNVIPTPRLSSVALKFIQDYIGGYGNPVVRVGDPDSLLNNASRNGLLDGRYWNWAAKVDQNIGNKHVISFSWNHYNRWAYQEGLLDNYPQHRISFGHTYSITPRIANQLRVAVARHHPTNTAVWGDYDRRPVTGGEFLKRWGIEGVADPGIGGAPQMTGIPLLSSRTQLRSVAQSAFTDDIRTQVYENLSYMTSGHTIKGGMAIINSTEDVLYHPGYGTFAFDGRFTGVQLADFLLGLPASSSRGESRPNVARRIREYAAYIQDDWRVTSKLTVSYGIRWDRYPPATEANGLYFNFDPASGKMLVPDQAALSRISKLWPTATLPVVLGSSLSYPEKLTSPTQRWLPRLSLAYRPTGGDFVIRGGFGVYNSILRYEALQTSGPFALTEVVYNEMIPQANGTFAPKYSFPNPFGAAVGVPASVPTGASVAKDLRPEYTMTWNLSGEKAILPSMALRVSYIGNKGTQLIHSFNMNTPLLSTQPFSQSRRPFPAYGNITRTENGLNSNYNALQFIVTRPAQKGLYLEASYTLQRGYVTATDYAWNRSRDRGRDGNWPTHDLIANFAFDLPFGPNQRWLSQAQGGKWVLARIVGGWSATGLFNWHSGRRSTPSYSGYDSGNINQASGRPDLVPGCNLYTRPSKLTSTLPWVNIACFTPPANGTLGNAPRNLLEGPAMWVISMSPFKEFLLPRWEGAKLRIGAQIYNILNSSSYWGEPNGNIGVYSRQADGSLVLRTPTYPLVSSGNWIRRGTENLGQRQFIFMAAIMF